VYKEYTLACHNIKHLLCLTSFKMIFRYFAGAGCVF